MEALTLLILNNRAKGNNMKLTKLFLLLPAFGMIACTNNPLPSIEEDKTIVTKEEFNATFQNLKLFKEDNVTLKTTVELGNRKEKMIVESENGVTAYYGQGAEETDKRYIEFMDDHFNDIGYEDGSWYSTSHPLSEATEFFFKNLVFVPFSFEDVSRNEETKSYVTDKAIIEIGGEVYPFEKVDIAFNESKPVSISFLLTYGSDPSAKATFTQAFTYGDAHVVNPK